MSTHRNRLLRLVATFVALLAVGLAYAPSAQAATSVVLARAPYVTDLTSSSAYVNWATETTQAVGSVIVQPESGGKCPATITWATSKNPIATPKTDPLVSGSNATTPWDFKVESTTEWQASVPVAGLTPSTPYCYAVFPSDTSANKQLWATQSFATLAAPSSSSTKVTFDVIGDTGEDTSGLNQGESNIYSEIGASGAQFLMIAGDVAYTGGTENDYGDLKQTGSEVSNIFGPDYIPLADGTPTFVADGNHGQNSDDLRIWPTPQTASLSGGAYSYGPPPAQVDSITNDSPSDWYAVQDGDVRIYVLDVAWADGSSSSTGTATGSLCGSAAAYCKGYQADADEHWQKTSTEYQWLAADLKAHPGGIKMAVWHYPIESINQTQVSDPYLGNLQSLLEANDVKLVFNGHAHTYQRFVPKAGGLTSFVTGGGGGTLQTVDGNTDKHGQCVAAEASNNVYALGWGSNGGSSCGPGVSKPTSALQVYNYLHVSVSGSTVAVNAVNAEGQTFDTTTVTY